jgi:type III pantothenate kinase
MLLALDIGNSQIFGGLIDENGEILFRFRKASKTGSSSDEIGIFLRSVIRENGFDYKTIKQIALCSVVPEVVHSIGSACVKYFDIHPFQLNNSVNTGLQNKYANPKEVGADRIANAIAGVKLYPDKNLIIIDLGTATTFCAITKEHDYLGGAILAGLRLNMESLVSKTSKLPSFEVIAPRQIMGNSTIESLQSGLYFGHLGAMREIIQRMQNECFEGQKPFIIGTGGFSSLFKDADIFDAIEPDMVFIGLKTALELN